jgi:hypothetical protein
MGDARKAGRKEFAYGCRRSEGAPQANEPKRSAQRITSPAETDGNSYDCDIDACRFRGFELATDSSCHHFPIVVLRHRTSFNFILIVSESFRLIYFPWAG